MNLVSIPYRLTKNELYWEKAETREGKFQSLIG